MKEKIRAFCSIRVTTITNLATVDAWNDDLVKQLKDLLAIINQLDSIPQPSDDDLSDADLMKKAAQK